MMAKIFQQWQSTVAGKEVEGLLGVEDFPFKFSLMVHCGAFGAIFVAIWLYKYWNYLPVGNSTLSFACIGMFAAMIWFSSAVSNNISAKKFQFGSPGASYDWLKYARLRMVWVLLAFVVTCNLLIWNTGALASPFIPFYIMVFMLALNDCRYPIPAVLLLVVFVLSFALAVALAEFPTLQTFVLSIVGIEPFDASVANVIVKKWFDGAFAIASMAVPVSSMAIAQRRSGSSGSAKADSGS